MTVAKNEDTVYTETELFALYYRPVSLLYVFISTSFIIWVFYFDKQIKQKAFELYAAVSKNDEPLKNVKPIICAIQIIDIDSVAKLNKGQYVKFKKSINFPMILMATVSGLVGALQGSVTKGFTISAEVNGVFDLITISYLLTAGLMAIIQLKSLNVAMEVYN